MNCTKCNTRLTAIRTLTAEDAVYRIRKCPKCEHIVYTSECEDSADEFKKYWRKKYKEKRMVKK